MRQSSFQIAQQHHQAGRLADAVAVYRRILSEQPNHADALHMLGVCEFQMGRHVEALKLVGRAIQLEPRRSEFHGNLGLFLLNLGQTEAAIDSLGKALALKPDYPQAHHNLADALRKAGNLDEAIGEYCQAIILRPEAAQTHNNLGDALVAAGQIGAAIASFRQALALAPDSAEILFNLGSALAGAASLDEAIVLLKCALVLRPGDVDTQNNLGNALVAAGHAEEAIPFLRQAVAARPGDANLRLNLGNALKASGRIDEPIEVFEQALALRPQWAEALSNLGATLMERGETAKGMESFRQALQFDTNLTVAASSLMYYLHFHPDYDEAGIYRELSRWNVQHARPVKSQIRRHENSRDSQRRLRIGYVSPDFYAQAESHFVVPLLEHHDHKHFEIFAYASVRRADAITDRIGRACDVWQNVIRLSDAELAEKIREDRIDILVDLTMHMRDNRLMTFARKPAPVQATWLAYPGGTGLETIDYRIADPYIDPSDESPPVYSERSIRLPSTWAVYDPLIDLPACPPRAGKCLGSLNNPVKLNDATLNLWSGVIKAVPDSRMLLLIVSEFQRDHIRHVFADHGLDPARVDFVGRASRIEYLRAFDRIDICLDPLPYNGVTTTCDSLWMGVPVVSLAGRTAPGRAGVSILANLGLSDLVARTPEEFVRITADLMKDAGRLADLRGGLRRRMQTSPLMDYPRFAREMEAAYRQMWRDWCAGA